MRPLQGKPCYLHGTLAATCHLPPSVWPQNESLPDVPLLNAILHVGFRAQW